MLMTPEQRFTKIESAIEALTETQTRHEVQLDKQNAGIRDLIVVSRTLIEAQKATDDRLNGLIGTVEELSTAVKALVRGLQKPNGKQLRYAATLTG